MKRLVFFIYSALVLLGFLYPRTSLAQIQTHRFEQLDSLNKVERRPVVVFIYTEWCKYCHQMENSAFTHDSLTSKLNSDFYFVKLDAEQKDNITYAGHTFRYKPNGANTGIHELTEQLGTIDGKVSYPTLTILNRQNEIVFQYSGVLEAKELLAGLNKLGG